MDTTAITDNWRNRLEKAERYRPRNRIHLRVKPEEVRAMLERHCPENCDALRVILLRGKEPTHVLLRPQQMEAILAHVDAEQNTRSKGPADVH